MNAAALAEKSPIEGANEVLSPRPVATQRSTSSVSSPQLTVIRAAAITPPTSNPTVRWKLLARWTSRASIFHHVIALAPMHAQRARGRAMKGWRLVGPASSRCAHRTVSSGGRTEFKSTAQQQHGGIRAHAGKAPLARFSFELDSRSLINFGEFVDFGL